MERLEMNKTYLCNIQTFDNGCRWVISAAFAKGFSNVKKYSTQYNMFWKQTASSSSEWGSNLLPKFGTHSMLCIFMTMEKVVVKAAGIIQGWSFTTKQTSNIMNSLFIMKNLTSVFSELHGGEGLHYCTLGPNAIQSCGQLQFLEKPTACILCTYT
jgi:flagellar biosynthesis protein FlhB